MEARKKVSGEEREGRRRRRRRKEVEKGTHGAVEGARRERKREGETRAVKMNR